jgi:hypothetical protein
VLQDKVLVNAVSSAVSTIYLVVSMDCGQRQENDKVGTFNVILILLL